MSCPENDVAVIEAALRHRWRWPLGLEALYEEQSRTERRRRAALSIAISGVIFLLAAVLDLVNGLGVLHRALPWRVGGLVFSLACAGCLLCLDRSARARCFEAALNVVPALAVMMLTQMFGEYAGPSADRYMLAAAFGVAALVATTPMTRLTARLVCATAALTYPIVLAALPRALPLGANWDLPIFAVGVLGTAAMVANRNESGRRASFIHRRRHEISAAELNVMNAELLRLATIDPLTGLANRRAFTQSLHAQWQSRRQTLAMAIFDVDWFKAYNDSAGHAAGDTALQAVAGAAERAVRRGVDLVARIGGEEFAIIMPGVDREQARALAERLRREVCALNLSHPGRPGCTLSVSVGVAWHAPADRASQTPDAFFNEADTALYAAKAEGRNCVVLAAPRVAAPAG